MSSSLSFPSLSLLLPSKLPRTPPPFSRVSLAPQPSSARRLLPQPPATRRRLLRPLGSSSTLTVGPLSSCSLSLPRSPRQTTSRHRRHHPPATDRRPLAVPHSLVPSRLSALSPSPSPCLSPFRSPSLSRPALFRPPSSSPSFPHRTPSAAASGRHRPSATQFSFSLSSLSLSVLPLFSLGPASSLSVHHRPPPSVGLAATTGANVVLSSHAGAGTTSVEPSLSQLSLFRLLPSHLFPVVAPPFIAAIIAKLPGPSKPPPNLRLS